MKASEIIARARSVSDLPNTNFITHTDELSSLNEAWKDIYSALVENDDDYYVTRITLSIGSGDAVAGSTNEYLKALPSDALKIRYVDWQSTQGFVPM